ncbi:hypothetical protein NIES2119_09975 [[Phormidium ambiguum] IAM M-71]|uniref:Uncharacterized protein n=1 Tax=[Phormidium ambiguum] IAM M-71 TaxID=454136 RepID=A0A1U7IMB7_9CYAN|nr:hypothetical protein [Phormidium ambiguum]OKH38355.1 hypothetical protein NIES2119_09975 [Phormidium ambiguum IAM M-71]
MSLTFDHAKSLGVTTQDIFVIISGKAYIDLSLLNGKPINNLNSTDFIDSVYKLFNMGYQMQEKFNLTAAVGNRIASFSPPFSGSAQYYANMNPPANYVQMQQTLNTMLQVTDTEVYSINQ